MNSNESIHTIFSNVIDKWSENFKKDMDPLLKVVDNIHMKNNIFFIALLLFLIKF